MKFFNSLDDCRFWAGNQFREHALFFALGLEEPNLKLKANQIYNYWQSTVSPQIFGSRSDKEALDVTYQPTMDLKKFKEEVLHRQASGEWLGWIFPSFTAHTLMELNQFVANNYHIGQPSAQDDLKFYLKMLKEHAAFAVHLLDPVEQKLFLQALGTSSDFADLENKCCQDLSQTFVELSKRKAMAMDKWLQKSGIGTPKVVSIIHPLLAAHVVREGQRAVQTMAKMQVLLNKWLTLQTQKALLGSFKERQVSCQSVHLP